MRQTDWTTAAQDIDLKRRLMSGPLNIFLRERRAHERYRVNNYHLKLDPGMGRPPIVCSVWDVSEGGTRLKMSEPIDLPRVVHILIGNIRRTAWVVWQKADHVGLEYFPHRPRTLLPSHD
jgi:hypothetical protein